MTLAHASQQGYDIGPALKALHMSPAAFWRLLRIRELAKNDTVIEAEWQDVYNILVQVKKGQAAPAWRQEERHRQIALIPEYFKVSTAIQASSSWRATAQNRRAWQDTLQARIDQKQSVIQALQATVQAVEEATLPALRDALVATIGANEGLSDAADWLTDQLLIDVKSGGALQTTRLLQAIETLQSAFFSLRTSRFAGDHPAAAWKRMPTETEAEFDEEWALMGTHAAWRAAMLVFFYPENSLLPNLRAAGDMTTEFTKLLADMRQKARRLTPIDAGKLANEYMDGLRAHPGTSLPEPLRKPRANPSDPVFILTERLTDAELKERGALASALFTAHGPQDYLKEIFYFVPIQLALQLQKAGHYIAALDWFQTVYAYNLPMSERKIYPRLALENADLPLDLSRQPHWLRQQLQPHALAATRPNPYTRYTLLSLVRCFLDFADAEFTRDTAESIANARSLYMTARSLLLLPDLKLPHPANLSDVVLPNPVQEALRLRAETQLAKLHKGRNIAGMKRQVEMETRPQALRPTPYRYSVLIERSKQLVGLAQHMEAAYLAALTQTDVESYNLRKAGYDLEFAQAGVTLQGVRVTEAQGGQRLAELQQERVTIQQTTYQQWINAGLTEHENAMLKNYQEINTVRNWGARADAALTTAQAILSAGPLAPLAGPVVGALAGGRLIATIEANNAEQRLQENALWASHERRVQEWTLQKSLADKDYDIPGQQIMVAKNHVAVAQQEQAIARMQAVHAAAMAEFLANKFTNADLFAWMSEVLGGVYSYFLQQATAMARLAQNQLTFERQEMTPSFIQADYWEPPAETGTTGTADGKAPDRRGLTGSARLLQDIYQLDLHAFETDKRKLNLSQTFSLARLAPVEIQRFRDTGVLPFATPMRLFDQAFPGHYLRLIKRVRTSVVALIPPTQGIRATLMAAGISRTAVGGNVFQEVVLRHDPELVALTSPANATGVFELDAQPEMHLPFEGIGVDTVWEFHMPRAANAFDYRTIADVLLTIDYTALHSFEYRQQVIKRLDQTISAERSYSFRHQFPDEWWALHNPAQPEQPMTIRVNTLREDFPPNIDELKIQHLLLYFARSAGETFEVDVTALQFTPVDGAATAGSARSIDGIISTRRGNGTSWAGMIGKPPAGTWEITLPASAQRLFTDEKIEDILLVLTYAGRAPAWPL